MSWVHVNFHTFYGSGSSSFDYSILPSPPWKPAKCCPKQSKFSQTFPGKSVPSPHRSFHSPPPFPPFPSEKHWLCAWASYSYLLSGCFVYRLLNHAYLTRCPLPTAEVLLNNEITWLKKTKVRRWLPVNTVTSVPVSMISDFSVSLCRRDLCPQGNSYTVVWKL